MMDDQRVKAFLLVYEEWVAGLTRDEGVEDGEVVLPRHAVKE